jgi:hypothetical protein
VDQNSGAKKRQGFSHREADAKSLLDEALRRGMGGFVLFETPAVQVLSSFLVSHP